MRQSLVAIIDLTNNPYPMCARVIKFPEGSPSSEVEKQSEQVRFEQLSHEMEDLEARLDEITAKTGGQNQEEIKEKSHQYVHQLRVELAEMRKRKFYSPARRREILNYLKGLRHISRSIGVLEEEYDKKWTEWWQLGLKLGVLKERDGDIKIYEE